MERSGYSVLPDDLTPLFSEICWILIAYDVAFTVQADTEVCVHVCFCMSSTCRGAKQSSNVHGICAEIELIFPPTGQRHWFSLISPQPGTTILCVRKEKENTQDAHAH